MNASEFARSLPLPPRLEGLCRAHEAPFTHYLPIEFFKWFPEELKPQDAFTCFLSSGTTQKDRSRSYFSKEGWERYRRTALQAFYEVLQDFSSRPGKMPGLSFVPPVSEWPDSSLARMVGWISESSPVSYISEHASGWPSPPSSPVWVFGTGFQFVNLIDDGARFPLPKGSVVFETGGTKGRTRSVTREELYEGIADVFSISPQAIVSEYGMCELASQAYDWVKPDEPLALSQRRFRFPSHVRVLIHEGQGRFKAHGTGSLAIWDPERVDYPWCLRTQDIATVWPDGSFQLKGRVPQTVLKGCSLPFEKIATNDQAIPVKAVERFCSWNEPEARARLSRLKKLWLEFLSQDTLVSELAKDLGSRQLALWAIEDLKRSAPLTDEKWLDAAKASLGKTGKSAATWLLIPPQTHGMTLFHPLLLGLLVGCRFHVRETGGSASSFEEKWLSLIDKHFPGTVVRLPSTFRVGSDRIPDEVDALMVFASDETVEKLTATAGLPVQGFGSALTLSLIKGHLDDDMAENLAKDAFSLGQRGCLSTRLAVLLTDEDVKAWAPLLLAKLDLSLSPELSQALDQEALERLVQEPACEIFRSRETLGPLAFSYPFRRGEKLTSLLSLRPFVLPLLVAPLKEEAAVREALLDAFPELRLVTSNESLQGLGSKVSLRALGHANAPTWNGFHEGRALFTPGDFP